MRTKKEVTDKFHELFHRFLQQRKEQFLCKSHLNCNFNCQIRVKSVGKVGFCQNASILNKSKTKMYVCNDDVIAKSCPYFSCRKTEQEVEGEFWEIIQSPSRCGSEYPKLAVLLWFLQECNGLSRWERLLANFRDLCRSFWRLLKLEWW